MSRLTKPAAAVLAILLACALPIGQALAVTISESITEIDLASLKEAPGVQVTRPAQSPSPAAPEEAAAGAVYTITQSGIYRFFGELQNGQIRVDAPDSDQVQIILSGVTLSSQSAPALYIRNAAETADGPAPVRIRLEAGSRNLISGASYAAQEDQEGQPLRGEGAISSEVSLVFDGGGSLELTASGKGIAARGSLTFDGGDISIRAGGDAVSAEGAGSVLMGGGWLSAKSEGGRGSGIRAGGGITISGGTLIASADPAGAESALASILGVNINGGTLAASGNSYGRINEHSAQRFVHLVFSQPLEADVPLVMTEKEGRALMAFAPSSAYTQLTLSAPSLSDGQYRLYQGGRLDSESRDGLYAPGAAYLPGSLLQNSGSTQDQAVIAGFMKKPGETEQTPRATSSPQNNEIAWSPILPASGAEAKPLPQAPASPEPTLPGSVRSAVFTLSPRSYFFIGVEEQTSLSYSSLLISSSLDSGESSAAGTSSTVWAPLTPFSARRMAALA